MINFYLCRAKHSSAWPEVKRINQKSKVDYIRFPKIVLPHILQVFFFVYLHDLATWFMHVALQTFNCLFQKQNQNLSKIPVQDVHVFSSVR